MRRPPRPAKTVLFALAVLARGCIPRRCDEQYVPAVCVTVVDAQSGAPVAATVTLTQDATLEAVSSAEGLCTARDPCCGGHDGQAALEVSASGYRTFSKTLDVEEDDSGCHPATVSEVVKLARP